LFAANEKDSDDDVVDDSSDLSQSSTAEAFGVEEQTSAWN